MQGRLLGQVRRHLQRQVRRQGRQGQVCRHLRRQVRRQGQRSLRRRVQGRVQRWLHHESQGRVLGHLLGRLQRGVQGAEVQRRGQAAGDERRVQGQLRRRGQGQAR